MGGLGDVGSTGLGGIYNSPSSAQPHLARAKTRGIKKVAHLMIERPNKNIYS
jgi:hypothetical protein